jgi:hypothetical protein
MRVSLFVTLFCVFILSGQALAQNHEWEEVPNPLERSPFSSIDVNNIKRLPGGTITYFEKTRNTIRKVEVLCEAKASRLLSEITLAHRDAYGNLVSGTQSRGSYPELWRTIPEVSLTYYFATRVCTSARTVAPQYDKPAAKKKAVNRTRKKKQ